MIKKERVEELLANSKKKREFFFGHGKAESETQKRIDDFIYARAYYDFEFFCDYFFRHLQVNPKTLEYTPSAPFHTELFEEQNKGWSLAIIARGHAKTTRGWLRWIWKVSYVKQIGHKDFLLWTSDKLIKGIMYNIRDEFQNNEKLKRVYGVLVPIEEKKKDNKLKTYTQTRIDFLNGCRIIGVSKFGGVRGLRPDEIWVDDPQENKEVINEEIAMKFINHMKTSLLPTLKPDGYMNITGTNLGKYCLVNLLAEDKTNDFRLTEYKAIDGLKVGYEDVIINGEVVGKKPFIEEGKPIWEERYSVDQLNKFLRNMGEEEFMQEFQNLPMVFNLRPVFPKDLMYKIKPITTIYEGWTFYCPLREDGTPEPMTNLLIGVDPNGDVSSSPDHGDKTGCSVYTRTGQLVAEWHGRVDQAIFAGELNNFFMMGFRGTIIIERNIGLALIKACQNFELLKNNLYFERKPAQVGRREQSRTIGWHTNESSKIKMIGETKFWLRYTSERLKGIETESYDGLLTMEVEVSQSLIDELVVFYVNEKGKCEALAGHHDDKVLGFMIALQGVYTRGTMEVLPELKEIGL